MDRSYSLQACPSNALKTSPSNCVIALNGCESQRLFTTALTTSEGGGPWRVSSLKTKRTAHNLMELERRTGLTSSSGVQTRYMRKPNRNFS